MSQEHKPASSNIPASLAGRIAQQAASAAIDVASKKILEPDFASGLKAAAEILEKSSSPLAASLGDSLERGATAAEHVAAAQAEEANRRAEAAALVARAQAAEAAQRAERERQRVRVIGCFMAIAGMVGAIVIGTLAALAWKNESWNWLLEGRALAIMCTCAFVSLGALFHGVRSLTTGRG